MTASNRGGSVAVVGLGLMGGSLARALAALPEGPEVLGYDVAADRSASAVQARAVDEVASDPGDIAERADVVVYATPLPVTLDLMTRHCGRWRHDALVMDVASLKTPVMKRAGALRIMDRWVGAHPMVGGEGSGFEAARENLFSGGHVWLVGGDETSADLVERAEAFWRRLGAEVTWTDAESHDDHMVLASHLPQVVANLLAARLAEEGLAAGELGPGGHDMTRLAASSPDMWAPLLEVSRDRLSPLLRRLARDQEGLADALDADDLAAVRTLMDRTRGWREGAGWS
jgi:prephenate dehydrogenase